MSRATVVSMFEALGFTVFDAYDRHPALGLLEVRPEISLLFVDVRMPGMSGPAELVRMYPEVSTSLMSGRRCW